MRALVTGATGFIGAHLTRALLRRGNSVRILARSPERAAPLGAAGAEVVIGDLGALREPGEARASGEARVPREAREPGGAHGPAVELDVSSLVRDIDVVFHLVSAIRAPSATFERVDIRGTERLLDASERAGVKRFVFPGTLSSYDLARVRPGAVIDERTPFGRTERLGDYARAKTRAEEAVLAAHRRGRLEAVIVRLGLTCGPEASLYPAHVGRLAGPHRLVMFGDGSLPLPLVLVDNAVDALILASVSPAAAGESFNIVDDDVVTQDEYLALVGEATGSTPRLTKLPRLAYYALGALTTIAAATRGKEPATTLYRVRTRLRRVHWDCSKAHRLLHWQSRVPLRKGLRDAFLGQAGAGASAPPQAASRNPGRARASPPTGADTEARPSSPGTRSAS